MARIYRKSIYKKDEFNENMTVWKTNIVKDLAKQINGSDCGLHTCMNMKIIANGSTLSDMIIPLDELKYEMTD